MIFSFAFAPWGMVGPAEETRCRPRSFDSRTAARSRGRQARGGACEGGENRARERRRVACDDLGAGMIAGADAAPCEARLAGARDAFGP
jgi:hypothetical protein